MWICNKCDTENLDNDLFCVECGTSKSYVSDNFCSNQDCTNHSEPFPNSQQKFCGKCGAMTTYWKQIQDAIGH